MAIMNKVKRAMALPGGMLRRLLKDPKRLFKDLEQVAVPPKPVVVDLTTWLHNLPIMSAPFNLRIDPALLDKPMLNVVLPSMAMAHMTGGPNTAINVGYRTAALGVPVRLISQDIGLPKDLTPQWNYISELTGLPRLPNVEIVDMSDRSKPMPVGANDVFMATAWWTAWNVGPALRQMRVKEFFYLIQDYEPAFYALGQHYAMALETYSMNYRAIICTPLLAEFMNLAKVGRFRDPNFMSRCIAFDPAVDGRHFYPEPRNDAGLNRLVIYARPFSAPRNLFEIAVYAINKAAKEGVFDNGRWELNFIGDEVPSMTLDNGMVIRDLRWAKQDAYVKLMRQTDVVVSLILSSHPSYVPLEAAACGAVVITNTFLNKIPEKLVALSPNIVPTEPAVDGIVEALREATRRVQEGRVERTHPLNLPRDWGQALEKTVASVKVMFEESVKRR